MNDYLMTRFIFLFRVQLDASSGCRQLSESGNDIRHFYSRCPHPHILYFHLSCQISKQTFYLAYFRKCHPILINIADYLILFGCFLVLGQFPQRPSVSFLISHWWMFQQVNVSSQIAQITKRNDSNLIFYFLVFFTASDWRVQGPGV